MAYDFYDVLAASKAWAEQAAASGRLNLSPVQQQFLQELAIAAPGNQAIGNARPILAAFMGGTGVGKSSLLNRLAEAAIAKAGVERPTSREVTLYQHHSVAVQDWSLALPLDHTVVCQHDKTEYQAIVWLDMPDFDSVEQENRRLVLDWLPFIDVLIYVVSPERYRDEKAWRILQAEGRKHAWLFVMNQWDRGLPIQLTDFKTQLGAAGFADPLIFCCSCVEPQGDEFADLLQYLHQLAGQQNAAELARHHLQQRNRQLQQVLHVWLNQCDSRDYVALREFFSQLWQAQIASLQQGMAWPLQQLARCWVEQPGQQTDIKIWDDWAQTCLDDVLDALSLQAGQLQVPVAPVKTALNSVKLNAGKSVTHAIELGGRSGLLQPGNAVQRFFLRLTALLEILLPLMAMAAVAYEVYVEFLQGVSNHVFLDLNFAVHSVMLIGLSWLLPFFLHKKLQPSLQTAALRGLQRGLQQGLVNLAAEVEQVIAAEQAQNQSQRQALAELIADCEQVSSGEISRDGVLGRVLSTDGQ